MDRSTQINDAERIVSALRMFENATEIIKQAHADESEEGVRKKRLRKLQEDIKNAEDTLAGLEENIQASIAKKEEEISSLEKDQERRVKEATDKANEEIKESEQVRNNVLKEHKSQIDDSRRRVKEAQDEVREIEETLARKKKEHQEFVRRIAR